MYRFALRPWWVVSHVFVAALVVTMVSLGFWQLRRLDEVKEQNDRLAARLSIVEAPLAAVAPDGVDVDAVVDRQVVVRGTYRADEQVLVRGRSLDDAPGSWVVVPLETDDGRVVAVNRGWIRNDGRYAAVPEEYRAVPAGEVEVHGLLQPSHERGTLGPTDPAEGTLTSLARLDLDRLDAQVDGDLLPVWVQLTRAEAGAPDPSPQPLDPPVVNDNGPHLSYAAQWFIFAAIAGGGYPLILRRRARERDGARPAEVAADEPALDVPVAP